jgi:hypothetical protein
LTYKKNNNSDKKEREKSNYTGFLKNRNFEWTVIAAAIIVIIVVLAVMNPFFAAPSKISSGSYYKVSNSDLLSNGSSAVYFLSWTGCPIGAANSWALYDAMNATTNVSGNVTLHTADPADIYSNGTTGQPGLLFNGNFTFGSSGHAFTFHPLYVYNETMSGTVANKSINGSLASYGLSLVNSTFPSRVAAIFNKYSQDITYKSHLTTTLLITGPHGTYILNAYMYAVVPGGILGSGQPGHGQWNPNTPQYVMSHLNKSASIKKAASTFQGYLGRAQ